MQHFFALDLGTVGRFINFLRVFLNPVYDRYATSLSGREWGNGDGEMMRLYRGRTYRLQVFAGNSTPDILDYAHRLDSLLYEVGEC